MMACVAQLECSPSYNRNADPKYGVEYNVKELHPVAKA
jgi:hypothetical protein